MDCLVGAVVTPQREVVVRRGLRRQVMRQIRPLTTGPVLIEDRVQDFPQRVAALMARHRRMLRFPRIQERAHHRPLLIGEITGIRLPFAHDLLNQHARQSGIGAARRSRHRAMTNYGKLTNRPLSTACQSSRAPIGCCAAGRRGVGGAATTDLLSRSGRRRCGPRCRPGRRSPGAVALSDPPSRAPQILRGSEANEGRPGPAATKRLKYFRLIRSAGTAKRKWIPQKVLRWAILLMA